MIKKLKLYQRIFVCLISLGILSLALSFAATFLHYFWLHETYQAILLEEQTKTLDEVASLTVKELLTSNHKEKLPLLLKNIEAQKPLDKWKQLQRISSAMYVSLIFACFVLICIAGLYWFLRRKIYLSLQRELDRFTKEVSKILETSDIKDKDTLLHLAIIVLETSGYGSIANWLRAIPNERNSESL